MFNLYEILRNAQGGHALDNLASQFDLTPEQADAAVKAMVPALSEEFMKLTSKPNALWLLPWRAGRGPAFGGVHRSSRRARRRPRRKRAVDGLRPSPWLSRRSRGDRPAGFERNGDQPRPLDANAPGDRFDDLRRPHQVHGKPRVWRDPRTARQGRGAGRPWPYSRPDSGRRPGHGQSAAASSRAWPKPRRQGGSARSLVRSWAAAGAPTAPGQAPAGGMGSLGGILGTILGDLAGRQGLARRRIPPPRASRRKCRVSIRPRSRRASRPSPKCCSQELPSSPARPAKRG